MSRMSSKRPLLPVRHMIVAMLLIVVPIVLINWFFTQVPSPEAKPVPCEAMFEVASKDAMFPLLAPQQLPDGWTCVRARWTPIGEPGLGGEEAVGDTWQLGYLTPSTMYISLDQRDGAPRSLVKEASRDGRPDGTSTVAGAEWERFVTDDGRTRTLALVDGSQATVVSGDLPYEALEAFVGTLAPGS